VVENRSKGRTYSRITLEIQAGSGGVLSKSVEFVDPVSADVTPDPGVEALLQPFRDQLGPILNTVVGDSTVEIPRADACGRPDGRLCESLVGNVATDAMRLTYGTDFAITNAGGLRASLTCPTADVATDFCPAFTPPPYPITQGQVLTVLPFGNVVATTMVDGAELKQFLENGVSSMPGANGRFAQVSGLCFTYDIGAAPGSRVMGAVRQAADGSCTGAPVDLSAGSVYSLAINDFMASGGDGYPVVIAKATTRDFMDQVLADFIEAQGTISPSIQGRINCVGATCPVVSP
jgi:2',3'-cyclic-nucleotide 2'-phosphodiesterase (5'-nucleotidase family)